MRKDMNKVLTESPRAGGKGPKKRRFDKKSRPRRCYSEVEADDEPLQEEELALPRESMKKRHKVDGYEKSLTDHIQPLRRFLISQAGRPWNDVWSDICQVLKGNGLQANHVKDHVKDFVGGIPHSGKTQFRPRDWHRTDSWAGLYVDEEGILRHQPGPKIWKRRVKKRYHYTRESDLVEYHKINGCWYRVELERLSYEFPTRWGGKRLEVSYYVKKKKALSRKKAHKLGLEEHYETVPPKLRG